MAGKPARRADDRLRRLIELAAGLHEEDFRSVFDAAAAEIGAEPAGDYVLDGVRYKLRGAGRPRPSQLHRHLGAQPHLLDLFKHGAIPAPTVRPAPSDPEPDHEAAAERVARLWASASTG